MIWKTLPFLYHRQIHIKFSFASFFDKQKVKYWRLSTPPKKTKKTKNIGCYFFNLFFHNIWNSMVLWNIIYIVIMHVRLCWGRIAMFTLVKQVIYHIVSYHHHKMAESYHHHKMAHVESSEIVLFHWFV